MIVGLAFCLLGLMVMGLLWGLWHIIRKINKENTEKDDIELVPLGDARFQDDSESEDGFWATMKAIIDWESDDESQEKELRKAKTNEEKAKVIVQRQKRAMKHISQMRESGIMPGEPTPEPPKSPRRHRRRKQKKDNIAKSDRY